MPDRQIQRDGQPTVAFVLSLLAGLWMLAAGSMMGGFGRGGMMGGWYGMSGWMWGRGMPMFGVLWPWFGIFAGIAVLIGAVMLYFKPRQRRGWGVLVLVASVLDLFVGMGGLLAGALGVIGGAMALSTKG
jgi:asparagine N-glycosylation enzyme membrane subunit Stt3